MISADEATAIDAAIQRLGPLPLRVGIVAMAENRVIGANGKIPWHLPADFRWFKRVTMGHTIVMGRRTWESLGKPLPGRRNVVVSRTLHQAEGADIVRSVTALDDMPGTVFVIGGADLFDQALPSLDWMLVSKVAARPDGDVRMPAFETEFNESGKLAAMEGFEIWKFARKSIRV